MRQSEEIRNGFRLLFCFQLTEKEADILRSQIATSSLNHGGRRYLPYGFTREGANMLSEFLLRMLRLTAQFRSCGHFRQWKSSRIIIRIRGR